MSRRGSFFVSGLSDIEMHERKFQFIGKERTSKSAQIQEQSRQGASRLQFLEYQKNRIRTQKKRTVFIFISQPFGETRHPRRHFPSWLWEEHIMPLNTTNYEAMDRETQDRERKKP